MLSVYFAGQCPSHAAMCETRPESPSARQVTLHTSKMKLCGIRRSHPSITRSSAPNPKGGNKSEKPLEKNMIHKMYVYVCVGAHINVCGCEPPKCSHQSIPSSVPPSIHTLHPSSIFLLPVVPHKAVAEVSKIGKKPIGEVGCCESGMAERSH